VQVPIKNDFVLNGAMNFQDSVPILSKFFLPNQKEDQLAH
jgi:hypothetical protein